MMNLKTLLDVRLNIRSELGKLGEVAVGPSHGQLGVTIHGDTLGGRGRSRG